MVLTPGSAVPTRWSAHRESGPALGSSHRATTTYAQESAPCDSPALRRHERTDDSEDAGSGAELRSKEEERAPNPVSIKVGTDSIAPTCVRSGCIRIVFIVRGSADIDVARGSESLTYGSVVTIPPGATLRLRPLGLLHTVTFQVHRAYVAEQMRWLPYGHPLVQQLHQGLRDCSRLGRLEIPTQTMQVLTPLLLHAANLYCTGGSDFALLAVIAELFDIVGKSSGCSASTPIIDRPPPRRETTAATRLLLEHPEHPWTVDELARRVLISPSQLTRDFRIDLGISPAAYLRQVRADRMAELLVGRALSVGQAAQVVGWSNSTVAARVFKRRHGVSPRKFASTHREARTTRAA